MNKWIKSNWVDIAICLGLAIFAPLFFYKLGISALQNWDEAWYADISRNIIKTGDFLNLTWAGFPYFDHPPFGFVMTALSYKLLGVSEFSARFASALFGLLSLPVLYLLGKELFNRWVGFLSAISLSSATWFLYRSRSGNLDIYLEMLFLLTLYLALKADKDKRFLIPFSISLGFLFLTKTMVPFTIIPALIVIFWKNKKISREDLKLPAFLFIAIFGSWVANQFAHQIGFLQKYFSVGLPGVQVKTDLVANFKQAKEFLHNGVGKWFWPGVVSLLLSIPLRKKNFLILPVFFLSFFIPFLFSQDGGIWHLIPLHPILILSFFGFSFLILKMIIQRIKNLSTKDYLPFVILLLVAFYVSFLQLRRSWWEFIDIPPQIPDEVTLSKKAATFSQVMYIEGSDFRPEAVFYSQKNIPQRLYKGDLAKFFSENKDFLLITYPRELQDEGISPKSYKTIMTANDKILLLKE